MKQQAVTNGIIKPHRLLDMRMKYKAGCKWDIQKKTLINLLNHLFIMAALTNYFEWHFCLKVKATGPLLLFSTTIYNLSVHTKRRGTPLGVDLGRDLSTPSTYSIYNLADTHDS